MAVDFDGIRTRLTKLRDMGHRCVGEICSGLGLRDGDLVLVEWRDHLIPNEDHAAWGIYLGIDGNGHAWMAGADGPGRITRQRVTLVARGDA